MGKGVIVVRADEIQAEGLDDLGADLFGCDGHGSLLSANLSRQISEDDVINARNLPSRKHCTSFIGDVVFPEATDGDLSCD